MYAKALCNGDRRPNNNVIPSRGIITCRIRWGYILFIIINIRGQIDIWPRRNKLSAGHRWPQRAAFALTAPKLIGSRSIIQWISTNQGTTAFTNTTLYSLPKPTHDHAFFTHYVTCGTPLTPKVTTTSTLLTRENRWGAYERTASSKVQFLNE